jgi:hypothetical protein
MFKDLEATIEDRKEEARRYYYEYFALFTKKGTIMKLMC